MIIEGEDDLEKELKRCGYFAKDAFDFYYEIFVQEYSFREYAKKYE